MLPPASPTEDHADAGSITQWLDEARGGDRAALDRVLQSLYRELHTMAQRQLGNAGELTLDATSLVHEAYLKLVGQREAAFDDRVAFFSYAATAMRSVVVDHARSRVALKRGGGQTLHDVADLTENLEGGIRLDEDLLSLDSALAQLAELDPKLAQVVELRYFGGLSELQIAELLERSERSVRRDWQKARMFLLSLLQGE